MKLAALVCLAACHVTVDPLVPAGVELTPERVNVSTYKILTPDMASGTAWAVAPDRVATAGHICDSGPGDYVLISYDKVSSVAHPLKWANNDDTMVDVCIMEAPGVATPLPLTDVMPMVGEEVGYVGYPLGKWNFSSGKYAGDVDGDYHWSDYVARVDCDHGASGSAMFTRHGVYGVLVRLIVLETAEGYDIRPGKEGCVASPFWQVQELLK